MTHRVTASLGSMLITLFMSGCGSDDSATRPTPIVVGSTWRQVEAGISNSVRAFADNDTMSLLVGDGGIVYSSSDGLNWQKRREGGPEDGLQDVLWFDSLFIAVGMNGTLIASTDGDVWTFIGIDDQANMYGLATNDSLVVAVGEGGSIYVSDDGIEWELHRQSTGADFSDIACRDSIWVACGDNGALYYSVDGLTWEPAENSFDALIEFPTVIASDNAFYTVAIDTEADPPSRCELYRSVNGINWYYQSDINAWYIHDLSATSSGLIAAGEGTESYLGYPDGLVFGSTGGSPWTEYESDAPFSLTCAAVFKAHILVGGSAGYILAGTSPDQLAVTTSGAEMTGVVWTGSEFVAVTNYGTVMRSPNGEIWTETHSHASASFERLAYSGSGFASLGGQFASTEIYSSPDGITWERTQDFADVVLKDITWGNGRFVVCGQDGTVFLSNDGQVWDRHYVGDSVTLRAVLWDGARYLAAASGIVYTSTDGVDWLKPTVEPTDDEPTISRLSYNGSVYCAIGMIDEPPTGLQGYSFVTSDRVHWTGYPIPVYDNLYDLAWTGTRFVACGRSGILASSADGTTWEAAASLTDQSLKSLAVGSGRAIATGSYRTVIVSP